ncbi:MAG: hypothetical protein R3345_11575 [Fulvivirga sp.]|nr:hypothetical protein [Fulvivirga sp.]
MQGILYLLALISVIWMIYDIWAVDKNMSTQNRVLWTLFAFIFSIGAAIIYYFSYKYNR